MCGRKNYKRFAGLGVVIVLFAGVGVAMVLVAGRFPFPSPSPPTVRRDQCEARPIAAELVTAIRNADAQAVRKLLDNGADVNCPRRGGQHAAHPGFVLRHPAMP